jgi:hypothetical protein
VGDPHAQRRGLRRHPRIALRSAWRERDEFRASFQELFETTRRYRAALEQIHWRADAADAGSVVAGQIAAAALAAPGAGGRATEERTT